MLQESKDVIIKNFLTLMKECDVQVLKDVLINKKVFSSAEINHIFSTDDERHNKRVFFFSIQKKEQGAFNKLIESLQETNQRNIAELLAPRQSTGGTKPFCPPSYENIENEECISTTEAVEIRVNPNETPLKVQVQLSNEFYDTLDHNKAIYFYSSRSKKRGRLLIINNYKYKDDSKHKYRNGATVDNTNLQELFFQMGGWDIQQHDNKTGEQMKILVNQFAQDTHNGQYDICFVIIMGHGNVSEISNETIIYGIDGMYVTTNDIQNKFTNEKCKGFRGKPKIFLFQVCRGEYLDYTIRHTETDSAQHRPSNVISNTEVISTNIRTQEDILTGYATLHGYKAHRDPYRGSWYIELICDKFMRFAHNYSVGELLQLVDQDLRKRMSDRQTMQTAEHSFKGFHNLYLNPGIYFEDGVMKHFHAK